MQCNHPGCDGELDGGFCLDCGRAPLKAPASGQPAKPVTTPTNSGAVSAHATAGHSSSRRASGVRHSTSSRRLGGVVKVPQVPKRDPAQLLMENPVVPERRRVCKECGNPVGRGRDGRDGLVHGFCPHCRTPFSFAPKLGPGDIVGGYRIIGCIARGGFGYVYLATHIALDQLVVLKGLLGSGDAEAREIVLAEQRHLVMLRHPNIVAVHDVVNHADPRSGLDDKYIVMEFLDGLSLKDLLTEHRRQVDDKKASLPLEQVLAYTIEILPALGHLHDEGRVYCDFKPDNVMLTANQVKLIDLGAVREAGVLGGPIFSTVGYQAPEVEDEGPSYWSDIYTVGRSMAYLAFGFTGFHKERRHDLPSPDEVPLLAEFESFHRLLQRACHRDPDQRFESAEEMAEQCRGVLHEVVAAQTGRISPRQSALFGPETRVAYAEVAGDRPAPAAEALSLPVPRVDPSDPAAALLEATTATTVDELLPQINATGVRTTDTLLRLAWLALSEDDPARAKAFLDDINDNPPDWRHQWYHGLLTLSSGRLDDALTQFEELRAMFPGERTARLALGACRELLGRHAQAAPEYEGVWRTDTTYVAAAFGLARCRLAGGDRTGAVEVLESVPAVSSMHVAAQSAALRIRVTGRSPQDALEPDLVQAAGHLSALRLEGEVADRLAVDVLRAALDWVCAGAQGATGDGSVLGVKLREKPLRQALEARYRSLARHVDTVEERVALVDRANVVRPRTWK